MNINNIITLKYTDLCKLCDKNVIKEIDETRFIKDKEDIDLLHTLLIRAIKKYKNENFKTAEDGYQILKKEFLYEKYYYQFRIKQKTFYQLNEDIDLSDGYDLIDSINFHNNKKG